MRFVAFLLVVAIVALGLFQTSANSALDPNTILGDCSKIQQLANVGSKYPIQLGFTSTLDDNAGPNGYLQVKLVYEGLGWVALGFSQNGGMVPGYAVVGVPNAQPTVYRLDGKRTGNVFPLNENFQTVNGTATQNATHTVLSFTKRLIEYSDFNIDGEGYNNFIVAWGNDNTFGQHSYDSTIKFVFALKNCVNGDSAFNTGSSPQSISVTGSSSPHKRLWGAHGLFASAAWGILAPIAVGCSLLRRVFITSDLPALWFKIHMTVNVLVFVFTTLAFSFAVRAISLSSDARHFRDVRHRTTGLIIMLMVFAQTMSGLLRPHLPHPKVVSSDEEGHGSDQHDAPRKSTTRVVWEIGHRLTGFTLLGFTWWQVQSGLKLYAFYFSEKDLSGAFWGITGALAAIIFILYVIQFRLC